MPRMLARGVLQTFSHYPGLPPPVELRLVNLPPHPCSYLPNREANSRAFYIHRLSGDLYQQFMDAGFRRSGKLIYQPTCNGCRACQSIRIPVERFEASKSQRRCWRRNRDLSATFGQPDPTEEKFSLYQRYIRQWHGSDDATRESFESFLYESPVHTLESSFRDKNGRLLAVGICDLSSRSLSSVYFYFDPAEAHRGLGTYGAMWEIYWARLQHLPYYYLGYYVRACAAMSYKANFRPYEILCTDGVWREQRTQQTVAIQAQAPAAPISRDGSAVRMNLPQVR
jgi:arginine-tRNA-protein transferase